MRAGKARSAVLAPLGLLACAATLALASSGSRSTPGGASATAGVPAQRGAELFARHCAACHGAKGLGDGEAAYLLSPAPRDFSSARFRLATTRNGVPTDDDLVATLRRGMPGSAMPPWEWMNEADLRALAATVRELAVEGRVQRLLEWAAREEEDLAESEAREIAVRQLTPGDPIPEIEPVGSDPALIAEGKRIFVDQCARCHGEDGRGTGAVAQDQWNEDGTPASPRDFTAGIFKGGTRDCDLACRVIVGLPGSSMPASNLPGDAEVRAVVAFVKSLMLPGAQERALQSRKRISAARTESLPLAPDDPAWGEAGAAWLALMPLWWRDERIEGLEVRALHDGRQLALRMSWHDPVRDADLLGSETFGDAAAVQLTAEVDPPLFTMGTAEQPVSIWHWKAAWQDELAGVRGLDQRFPHRLKDARPSVPEDLERASWPARAANNAQAAAVRRAAAEELVARGLGTIEPVRGPESSLAARATWRDGTWELVLVRALGANGLQPGASAFAAFAVWDGTQRDRNGQKSVTVWHELALAP